MCFPNILVRKQMYIWIPQNKSSGVEMLINFLCLLLPEILLNNAASNNCEKSLWNAWVSTQALSAPISSLSLLLVQTQEARWKAATPEQPTGAHLYLVIAKSGYLFHAFGNVMSQLNVCFFLVKVSQGVCCNAIINFSNQYGKQWGNVTSFFVFLWSDLKRISPILQYFKKLCKLSMHIYWNNSQSKDMFHTYRK